MPGLGCLRLEIPAPKDAVISSVPCPLGKCSRRNNQQMFQEQRLLMETPQFVEFQPITRQILSRSSMSGIIQGYAGFGGVLVAAPFLAILI